MAVDELDRNVAILAVDRLASLTQEADAGWSADAGLALRRSGARLLDNARHAATLIERDAGRLVAGIDLLSPLSSHGGMGPLWPSHPFASPAFGASYRLREPDITRGLERMMATGSGSVGARRARSFLRALAECINKPDMLRDLGDDAVPIVASEHPVRVTSPSAGAGLGNPAQADRPSGRHRAGRSAIVRIDLLFRWPIAGSHQSHVVVVEAKLGSSVASGQLTPYRQEARRLAKGGPISCFLLTLRPDAAERRHPGWAPVRWPSLMGRWEHALATANDDDPEFTRLRAHIWQHILKPTRSH